MGAVHAQRPPQRILLAQTSFLGDVVLTTALARRLLEAFPAAEVHWLVRPDAREIITPLVGPERVLVYAKRAEDAGYRGLLRLAERLAARRFDVGIAVQRSLRTALVLRLARIPLRIGFSRAPGALFYNKRVAYVGAHARDRLVALAAGLGVDVAAPPLPRLQVDEASAASVQARLAAAGVEDTRPLVVLAPAAAWETKRWPPRHFAALAERLLGQGFGHALVVGAPGDGGLAAAIRAEVPAVAARILDWTGATTLAELIALIDRAALVVANDSAPGHIAAALGKPLVSCFGPTVAEQGFAPLGASVALVGRDDLACRPCSRHGTRVCPIGTHECLEGLEVEGVLAACARVFENAGERR
ncbi:MAG: lipopolysaccharide heptosyltransferase II [Deltaproteobacteria bacterium]